MKRILVSIVASFFFASIALGAESQKLRDLKKAAEQGDMVCQNTLATLYYQGIDVPQDYAKAAAWFEKAANIGSCFAQVSLAEMYMVDELGFKKDYKTAAYWLEKAANQEDVLSQKRLGFMYSEGMGVEKDTDKSIYWFEKAAKRGDYDSMLQLVFELSPSLYSDPDNFKKAYTWVLVANNIGQPLPEDVQDYIHQMVFSYNLDDVRLSAKTISDQIKKDLRRKECPNERYYP